MATLSRRRAVLSAALLLALAAAIGVDGASAAAPRSVPRAGRCGTITACAMNVLAPASGTHGVYLRQVGGPVLASANATFAFEPASSIKPIVALYVLDDMKKGFTTLSTPLPRIDPSGGPGDCPPATIAGTESKASAIQQMLEVSDNNRTRELMQYFGVANLNSFAASLGLAHTHFHTSVSPPGFNVIGCNSYSTGVLPPTLDGNTITLVDMANLWTAISSQLPPYANAFYQLGAGREMLNSQGYDFTGIWPSIKTVAGQVKPASMSANQLASFLNHAFVSVKGGSYDWNICSSGSACERTWAAWGFYLQLPGCSGTAMHHTGYVGGDFVNGSTTASSPNPVGFKVLTPGAMQLVTSPIRSALASWAACAPKALPKLRLSSVSSVTSFTPDLVKLAGVADSDPNDVPADMQATVSWGDGTATSDATVVPAGKGHFNVAGWHEYAASGVHTITVSVTSEATGAKVTVHSKLTVT